MPRIAILLVGLFLPAHARTETTEGGLIPRRQLFPRFESASYRTRPRLSPDGQQLFFVATENGKHVIHTRPMAGTDAREHLATSGTAAILACQWAMTNQHILFTRQQSDMSSAHVFCLDEATGKTVDLTPFKNAKASVIALSRRFAEEVMLMADEEGSGKADVFRVNFQTGARRLVMRNPGYSSFFADDDFQVRLAGGPIAGGGKAYYTPAENGDWRKVFDALPDMAPLANIANPLGIDATGQRVYLRDNRHRDTAGVTAFHLESGKTTLIAASPSADIGNVFMHPTRRTVLAASYLFDRARWQAVDPNIAADLALLAKVEDGELSIPSCSDNGNRWIAAFEMIDSSTRYYLYDRIQQKSTFLFASHEAFKGLALADMRSVIIEARDGLKLVCYLTLPRSEAKRDGVVPRGPLPLVVLIHGGPYGRDEWGFNGEHQFFANRGYAVLSVNFRGSTGLGKQFVEAANHEWGGKILDDVLDAADWAVREKIADPKRIALMGSSFGGYLTLLALTRYPDRFACGIDRAGFCNMRRYVDEMASRFPDYAKRRLIDLSDPQAKQRIEEWSPLRMVDRIQRPVLMFQGGKDGSATEREEKEGMAQQILGRKGSATYVEFPSEGHTFFQRETRLAYYAMIETFLGQHLGGACEPLGDDVRSSVLGKVIGGAQIRGLTSAATQAPAIEKDIVFGAGGDHELSLDVCPPATR